MGNRFMPAEIKRFGRKPKRFSANFLVAAGSDPAIVYPVTMAAAGFTRAQRMGNGKYEFELVDVWPQKFHEFFGGPADAILEYGSSYEPTADNVDMYTQTGVSRGASGRYIITVRLKTAAVNTEPGAPSALCVWLEVESAP